MSISSVVEVQAWRFRFDELPAEVAKHFSDVEREAYCAGASSLTHALRMTGELPAMKACEFFHAEHPFRVYVEDFLTSPKIWFSLSSIKLDHELRLRLPKSQDDLSWAPERVRRIFRSVGGLTGGNPYSPRLLHPDKASECEHGHVLIAYGDGNQLLLSKENASRYFVHAEGQYIDVSLDLYLDEFFSGLFSIAPLFRGRS